jgi:prolyl-tRNA editing enzyme YbaK/EbsC (Cys-tRNA(Pro) deacylase)
VLIACIPGNAELDLKAFAAASGNKKVEMVHVKEIQQLTGYIRGGVSPITIKKRYSFFWTRVPSRFHIFPSVLENGVCKLSFRQRI